MKKLVILLLISLISLSYAEAPKEIIIDDFEDGAIDADPAWWTFGASDVVVEKAKANKSDKLSKYTGKKSLKVVGSTEAWYIGGMGTYLAKDASNVTHLKMMIYGNGPQSGKINFQLYDDDNGNMELEQDVNRNYEPIFDDKFEFSLDITWKGWKVVVLDLERFKDANRAVGDNIWNPTTENESGGLLHFQLIFLANGKRGDVNAYIDNIKFISLNKKR
jgi:hypothetical protein